MTSSPTLRSHAPCSEEDEGVLHQLQLQLSSSFGIRSFDDLCRWNSASATHAATHVHHSRNHSPPLGGRSPSPGRTGNPLSATVPPGEGFDRDGSYDLLTRSGFQHLSSCSSTLSSGCSLCSIHERILRTIGLYLAKTSNHGSKRNTPNHLSCSAVSNAPTSPTKSSCLFTNVAPAAPPTISPMSASLNVPFPPSQSGGQHRKSVVNFSSNAADGAHFHRSVNTSSQSFSSSVGSGAYPLQAHRGSTGGASSTAAPFTTKYHRGSLAVSSSIYFGRPEVVETTNVVVGRDDDDNKTINGYVILGELGKGSYGKVKLAEHHTTKELFAVKIVKLNLLGGKNNALSGSGSSKDNMKQKLLREIAVMKKVAHPNLVRLHEVMNDPDKEKMYLVMQYIPCGTIAIKTSPSTVAPLDADTVRDVARQVAAGLRALHRNGIFHRDVKPDNLLLGENGQVYVADFGVSVICAEDGVEGVEGTPAFMAPELCRGELYVKGELVDTWALGVTLYQLMYGFLPFTGDTMLQLTRRIVNDPVTFPANPNVEVPDEFIVAIKGLLEKNPDRRWTLRDFLKCAWLCEDEIEFSPSTIERDAALEGKRKSDDCEAADCSQRASAARCATKADLRAQHSEGGLSSDTTDQPSAGPTELQTTSDPPLLTLITSTSYEMAESAPDARRQAAHLQNPPVPQPPDRRGASSPLVDGGDRGDPSPKKRSVTMPLDVSDVTSARHSTEGCDDDGVEEDSYDLADIISPAIVKETTIEVSRHAGGLGRHILDTRESFITGRAMRSGVFQSTSFAVPGSVTNLMSPKSSATSMFYGSGCTAANYSRVRPEFQVSSSGAATVGFREPSPPCGPSVARPSPSATTTNDAQSSSWRKRIFAF